MARADKTWTRIILDPKARTPLESQLVKTASKIRTLVFVGESADALSVNQLEDRGVEVRRRPFYSVDAADPENPSERPSGFDLNALNRELGSEGITQLLIEGGGETLGRALAQRLIQRIHFFYAPKLIGGSAAPRAVGGPGAGRWEDMLRLSEIQWRRLGPDAYLTAKVSVWGKDAPPK
jgi:diaminohydroxyphosphoribosylaminopyrimidine deaminase/5-amino-6-(5-phosphoribosylamino)uracil reductase